MADFRDASAGEINLALQQSAQAFESFKKLPVATRAELLRTIARELDALGDAVLETAAAETNLPLTRLRSERARTIFQLNSYADACQQGFSLDARIDTAMPDRNPPRPDIRKMNLPLGPVVVFGSSNFPFAYSTAGGDTASALAAGCTVLVKAHPAHPHTSEMVAGAIHAAIRKCGLPAAIFTHIHGSSFDVGRELVMHPLTSAVGFTGSYTGGKQLFDWANGRVVPIPVFAEMGSVNPVFLFPQKLAASVADIAAQYAASITLGTGQFCTNPGLLIGMEGPALQDFLEQLGKAIEQVAPADMLHAGISEAYARNRVRSLEHKGVTLVAAATEGTMNQGRATLATVDAATFMANPFLHKEVFGPYSLMVRCRDKSEMAEVATKLEGQLTATVMATEAEAAENRDLISTISGLCGRLVFNGVPTGVEVCWSMQHGGPFPASTDSRFTAVGPDAIRRYCRPLSFQSWPATLLPEALQDENPLGIWRMLNNDWTRAAVLPG